MSEAAEEDVRNASPAASESESPGGPDPVGGHWSLSVARFLGHAARWATPPIPAGRPADPRPVSALVDELMQMVQRASSDDARALEKDAEFWRVIEALHGKRPRIVRGARSKGGATSGTPEGDSAPADAAARTPTSAKKSEAKKKTASEEAPSDEKVKDERVEDESAEPELGEEAG